MWIWNENIGRVRSRSMLLGSQHFGGRGVCWSFGMGTRKSDKHGVLIRTCTDQTTSWLMHSWSLWCMDSPQANTDSQDSPRLGLGGSHHLPPYSILCAYPWDQHPNVILSRDSQMGVPKFPELKLSWLWGPITLRVDLRWRWGLKQSCSPHWDHSNDMFHATCTQRNWGNSWLLVLGS